MNQPENGWVVKLRHLRDVRSRLSVLATLFTIDGVGNVLILFPALLYPRAIPRLRFRFPSRSGLWPDKVWTPGCVVALDIAFGDKGS